MLMMINNLRTEAGCRSCSLTFVWPVNKLRVNKQEIKKPCDLCGWFPPVWGRGWLPAASDSIPSSSLAGLEPHWLPSRSEPGARWESLCEHSALLRRRGSVSVLLGCIVQIHFHWCALTFYVLLHFAFSFQQFGPLDGSSGEYDEIVRHELLV